MTKILYIILSILISCIISLPAQDYVFENPYYLDSEIGFKTYTYAQVNVGDIVKIWEEEFEISKSISYLIDYKSTVNLSIDNYRVNDNKTRPVLILIHGGAFLPNVGSKEDSSIKMLARQFSKRGFSVFSVEYRTMNFLTPSFLKAAYTATQDVKASIRYISNHQNELSIDAEKIFICGVSAGGITTLHSAYLDDKDNFNGRIGKFDRMYGCLDCIGEERLKDYSIKGIINIAGGTFDLSVFDNNKHIPVLSIHGTDDNIVPIECDFAFKKYAKPYNNFIDKLILSTSHFPKLNRELREAKISKICGSSEVDNHLNILGGTSDLMEIQNANHYLLLSANGVIKTEGLIIVNKISKFLKLHM